MGGSQTDVPTNCPALYYIKIVYIYIYIIDILSSILEWFLEGHLALNVNGNHAENWSFYNIFTYKMVIFNYNTISQYSCLYSNTLYVFGSKWVKLNLFFKSIKIILLTIPNFWYIILIQTSIILLHYLYLILHMFYINHVFDIKNANTV